MSVNKESYCYVVEDTEIAYSSLDDAIYYEADLIRKGRKVEECKRNYPEFGLFFDVDNLLEQASESLILSEDARYYDEYTPFDDATNEDKKELRELLSKWSERLTSWEYISGEVVREISVTEEDIRKVLER